MHPTYKLGTSPMAVLFVAACLVTGCTSKTSKDSAPQDTNHAPIADAGTDITQSADVAVPVSGLGSYDPDGDLLSYHWSFEHVPDGSNLPNAEAPFLVNHTADASTQFSPDAVGTYVVMLKVSDGRLESAPDYMVVIVTEPTTLPVAEAGPDQVVTIGTSVTLDGSASFDPQGRALTYQWNLVDIPSTSQLTASSIGSATSAIATVAPDVRGVYVVNLIVNNSLVSSTPDALSITVAGENGPPTANAGIDFNGEDCTNLPLDASGSVDPEADPLVYFWELQDKPAGSVSSNASFSDRAARSPTFFADMAGTYTFSCAVYDGVYWSSPDLVVGTLAERTRNSAPLVDAGQAQAVAGGDAPCELNGYSYTCDACNSAVATLGADAVVTDVDAEDGPTLRYEWTVIDGSATISTPNNPTSFVSLEGAEPLTLGSCEDTPYTFQLQVTDCTGASSTDTVVFTVNCCGVKAVKKVK